PRRWSRRPSTWLSGFVLLSSFSLSSWSLCCKAKEQKGRRRTPRKGRHLSLLSIPAPNQLLRKRRPSSRQPCETTAAKLGSLLGRRVCPAPRAPCRGERRVVAAAIPTLHVRPGVTVSGDTEGGRFRSGMDRELMVQARQLSSG